MRRFPYIAVFISTLIVGVVLLLSGCGGKSHPTAPAPTGQIQITQSPAVVINSQSHCSKQNFTMQCAYPRPIYDINSATYRANGIDFAWSCPDPGGYAFGASYLSPDTSKNWSSWCIGKWRGAGRRIVMVWESTADRAGQGYSAGRDDALRARDMAASLGAPGYAVIFFAIDYDASGGDVVSYFQGVRSVLPYERTGAYGGIRPLEALHNWGLIKYGWQAYAWSYGQWGFSQLRQVQNGDAVDWDLALSDDFGAWPFQPAPPPDPYRILDRHVWSLPYGQRASEYNTVRAFESANCSNPVRRQVCKSSRWHLQLLRDRLYWVAHHKLTNHGWVSVRKARWGDAHLGQRFHRIQYDLTR